MRELGIVSMEVKNKKLSPRETSIIEKLTLGMGEKEVAEDLKISIRTVQTHKHRIFLKLGALNTAHAVGLYIKQSYQI